MMNPHHILDFEFGPDGETKLQGLLEGGTNPNLRAGPLDETLLHVATRRYRIGAVECLLDHGADINVRTKGGKTSYTHALRRGFNDLADLLADKGASTDLNDADRFAVAVVNGKLADARKMLKENPALSQTGNPEEDRLLADVAGRNETEPVKLLITAGANLSAMALDDGTALHQAAWFGQPDNVKLLVDAGAPLDVFDKTHGSSPLHWAAHGSRHSGGVEDRQDRYVAITQLLLDAGSSLYYPDRPDDEAYKERLLTDASPAVVAILRNRM